MQLLLELFADLLLLFEDLKFWHKERWEKKRRQRKGLPPKSGKIEPSTYYFLFAWLVVVVCITMFSVLRVIYLNPLEVEEDLLEIEHLLSAEYEYSGRYPEKLTAVIRKNPLRANIHKDVWDHEYFYEPMNKGNGYRLICKGKDGILFTDDDVERTKNQND